MRSAGGGEDIGAGGAGFVHAMAEAHQLLTPLSSAVTHRGFEHHVEGRPTELLGVCADVFPLELDLTDLVSADMAGIEAIQRLRHKGAILIGAPGYLQLKIDSPPQRLAIALPPKKGWPKT